MTTMQISELKLAHRAMWDSGDYAAVARDLVAEISDVAVVAAAPRPGDVILDVATGSGNAAIPAARAGARVTGLDLSPVLLDVARQRANAAAVEVEWIEGDAEALPYPAASFDTVISVLGVQFAPRHEVAARELARVLRPEGNLVLCNWTPSGFIGQFLKVVSPRLPKPPESASPPPLWGDEGHVSALFEEPDIAFEFERRSVTFEHGSPTEFIDYMATNYGPLLKARERLELEGQWAELRAELIAFSAEASMDSNRFVTDSEYLLARGRKGRITNRRAEHMSTRAPDVELFSISPDAAEAMLTGDVPPGMTVPDDYPTEFTSGVAESGGGDRMTGPYFIRRRSDGLIVGELGGAFTDDSTIEIGYAVVDSLSGRGYASAAVVEFLKTVQPLTSARRVVAHTPLDRPASARVLAKAGFSNRGETVDEHEGVTIKVEKWEFALR